MGIHKLSTLAEDTVGLVAGVLADVDIGIQTLFSDREVSAASMNRNAADTVGIETIVSHDLFGVQVVGLVLVTSDVDDQVILKEVDVVALGRLLTHQVVETDVAATDFAVFDGLVDVVVGVALSDILGKLNDDLFVFASQDLGCFFDNHWGGDLSDNHWGGGRDLGGNHWGGDL